MSDESNMEKTQELMEDRDTVGNAPATVLTRIETDSIGRFFGYKHLPNFLQEISRRFHVLAEFVYTLPQNPERDNALRKLLEAKDSAVRAEIYDSLVKIEEKQ